MQSTILQSWLRHRHLSKGSVRVAMFQREEKEYRMGFHITKWHACRKHFLFISIMSDSCSPKTFSLTTISPLWTAFTDKMGYHAWGYYVYKKKRTNEGAVKNWSMKQFNKSAVLEQEPRDPDQIHKQTPFIMYCVYNQLLCVHWAISEHGYIGDDLLHIWLSTDDLPKAFET